MKKEQSAKKIYSLIAIISFSTTILIFIGCALLYNNSYKTNKFRNIEKEKPSKKTIYSNLLSLIQQKTSGFIYFNMQTNAYNTLQVKNLINYSTNKNGYYNYYL